LDNRQFEAKGRASEVITVLPQKAGSPTTLSQVGDGGPLHGSQAMPDPSAVMVHPLPQPPALAAM
jgi:hypothetical protein